MKQFNLFNEEKKQSNSYTSKVKAPVYEPKNIKPHLMQLIDNSKTKRLIREIDEAKNVTIEEKRFLIDAARRHNVFNYQLIADYYAHSNKEVQQLMERSALVLIDLDKAIEYGFMKLSLEMAQQYLKEKNDE